VTRPRTTAPGRVRPVRRGALPIILLLLIAFVAACASSSASGTPPAGSGAASAGVSSDPGDSAEPGGSDDASATDEPSEEPTEEATDEPTEEPTAEPTDGASPSVGPASACSGTAENKDFYAAAAAAVQWTVYCPVLPKGWFVVTGRYRLADGGRLEISYRGPSGASFTLREGAFCADTDGCVPAGSGLGAAGFGDLDGTLISADDGSWAIVVEPGANPSWLLVADVASEAAARDLGSSLVAVEG
jgi:hypothetical protein